MKQELHELYLKKAKELVSKMTIEEKTSQLCSEAPAIERLGIPAYHWWNEGLHGVARAGIATIFPQSIALAATFSREALRDCGRITALEGRIKYNAAAAKGDRTIYKGLTFWSPNINIYRDPRWGRGQETYGEDPVLTSVCGEEYIKSLQEGDDDRYLHAAACAKHFAVHSGPEGGRHGFDSVVNDFDLNDTYLPAFKWCVEEADVQSVMGAYNMINGIPSCAHPMIEEKLRKEWGFTGYFVSDCGALADMHMFCLVTHTAIESAALALKAGCDLNCGQVYLHVLQAYNEGRVTEEDIDRAVTCLMAIRYKLGMFDPECSYNKETDYSLVECDAHRKLSYEAAVRSAVLLKNDGVLPLDKKALKTVAVIGPNAVSAKVLEGNYNGRSGDYRTVLDGVKRVCGDDVRVLYAAGCPLYKQTDESCAGPRDNFAEALTVAEAADAVILCMGLDPSIEGEEGDANNEYGAGDKSGAFPGLQPELMEKIAALGKPTVLVPFAGGALDLNRASEIMNAILFAWYPGVMGGDAIADLLFGVRNPSGKTPVTFYRSLDELPAFTDYSMEGRTYRYMKNDALYPFGFGLSYTTFSFGEPRVTANDEPGRYTIEVDVTNTGDKAGETVVEIYATYGKERYITPNCKLCAFDRVSLEAGETKTVTLEVEPTFILLTDKDGSRYLPSHITFHALPYANAPFGM